MKRNILIILNDAKAVDQVKNLHSTNDLNVMIGVEAAIEQLYKMNFDGVIYEAGMDVSEEKKLLKILSLEDETPVIYKKESSDSWETSLQELVSSLPYKIHFIDDGFKNAGLNICLN